MRINIGKPSNMDDQIKDFELLEKAGFTKEVKSSAYSAISSLHYLKGLSVKLGIPFEQITAEQIIFDASSTDAQIRDGRKKYNIS